MRKDKQNKEAHDQSAQVACEAAAAIRTVASLTREDECLDEYKSSLEEPLHRAVKAGAMRTCLYGLSQGSSYFVMALVFWYGSTLLSKLEITLVQFFIGLMVRTSWLHI